MALSARLALTIWNRKPTKMFLDWKLKFTLQLIIQLVKYCKAFALLFSFFAYFSNEDDTEKLMIRFTWARTTHNSSHYLNLNAGVKHFFRIELKARQIKAFRFLLFIYSYRNRDCWSVLRVNSIFDIDHFRFRSLSLSFCVEINFNWKLHAPSSNIGDAK